MFCSGILTLQCFFQTAMLCLCTSMIALMMTLVATPHGGKPMFFIWVCAIFFTFSGNFALFPTATAKSFGQKYMAINFGLVFTSQVKEQIKLTSEIFTSYYLISHKLSLILLYVSVTYFVDDTELSFHKLCRWWLAPLEPSLPVVFHRSLGGLECFPSCQPLLL